MVTAGGDIYCYHFDASANVVAMTDSGESVVNAYVYMPFGQIANEVEAVEQPFRFAAQFGVMTGQNGLYYMKARYYDAEVGRFISEDPLGFEGGDLNLYQYAHANPIMFMDPIGLCGETAGMWADIQVGSTNYQWWDPHPEIGGRSGKYFGGRFSPKCTAFVYDALSFAGCAPGRNANGVIPLSSAWDNPNSNISGYSVIPADSSPQIGDIVADDGHVGIFYPLPDGNPGTISAASSPQRVIHNNWGFRPGNSPTIWRHQ
jgi:RHS repeat-associated protein